MSVTLVAARSENNVIGRGSEIPWRAKGEQKLFKDITMGGALIMGRKTFDSIGRPLPGRETIIITRNADYEQAGCTTVHSLEAALAAASKMNRPAYIVGGGEIYRQALDIADGVHLTTVHVEVEGDIVFPDFPTDAFTLVSEQKFQSNLNYTYQYYEKIR